MGEIIPGKATLGEYLKKRLDLFHPALKNGLNAIWGYARRMKVRDTARKELNLPERTPNLW